MGLHTMLMPWASVDSCDTDAKKLITALPAAAGACTGKVSPHFEARSVVAYYKRI